MYYIDYCNGTMPDWAETLEDAMRKADEGATRAQKDIIIFDDREREIARRHWRYSSFGDWENTEYEGRKHADPAIAKVYGDQAAHAMTDEDPRYIALARKTVEEAYKKKVEAKDITRVMMAHSYAHGVIGCMIDASLIRVSSAHGVQEILSTIFDD